MDYFFDAEHPRLMYAKCQDQEIQIKTSEEYEGNMNLILIISKLYKDDLFNIAFLISKPSALPKGGGTALPISLCLSPIVPENL